MNKLLLGLVFISSAASAEIYTSSPHRVSLLELYTSEGCSSCPPAEAWISRVYRQGYPDGAVVPLAFHVTYWDYLGWKDRFSEKDYDQRQRTMVSRQGGRTVYTPQFFLNSKTTRSVQHLKPALDQLSKERAAVKIWTDVSRKANDVMLEVRLDKVDKKLDDIMHVTVVPYENNLHSLIKAGENAGRNSTHQFVARDMQQSLMTLKGQSQRQFYLKQKPGEKWQGIVVFVESGKEIIQVLNIPLDKS